MQGNRFNNSVNMAIEKSANSSSINGRMTGAPICRTNYQSHNMPHSICLQMDLENYSSNHSSHNNGSNLCTNNTSNSNLNINNINLNQHI